MRQRSRFFVLVLTLAVPVASASADGNTADPRVSANAKLSVTTSQTSANGCFALMLHFVTARKRTGDDSC